MSLPKLTKTRLKILKALHGWEFVARMLKDHRPALRKLAQVGVEIEKLTNTPRWRAGRIALARFRIMRGPKAQPKHRIPNGYRSNKIGHWLKDHTKRIADMIADAACMAATGHSDHASLADTAASFNHHIEPIAKLYDFKLQMVIDGDCLVLRGDLSKALCVLMYLSTEKRTPEIDWMLDVVTVFSTAETPLHWKGAWNKNLRHTKRGAWWRRRRELREQRDAIEAPKEHQRQLEQADWAQAFNEDVQRKQPYGNRVVAPRPTMARQEGDRTNAKRFLGQAQYYPNVFKK
jgi:hypothetical protein